MGREYSLSVNLLSLVGWTSIGNSNWFICVMLMLYTLTLAAFAIDAVFLKKKGNELPWLMFLFSLVLWLVFDRSGKLGYWYNTFMCYPVGMIWSGYKERIDSLLICNTNYFISLAAIAFMILLCWLYRGSVPVYSVFSVLVTLLIVMTTMKVKIGNPYLQAAGKYSFSIFILQRIPMIILSELEIRNPLVFTLLSFVIVCALAYVFERLLGMADRYLLGIQK